MFPQVIWIVTPGTFVLLVLAQVLFGGFDDRPKWVREAEERKAKHEAEQKAEQKAAYEKEVAEQQRAFDAAEPQRRIAMAAAAAHGDSLSRGCMSPRFWMMDMEQSELRFWLLAAKIDAEKAKAH